VSSDFNLKLLHLYSTSSISIPHESYTLKSVFMCDTHVKRKEKIPTYISPCCSSKWGKKELFIHTAVNTYRHSGSVTNKKELNRNTECSLERKWLNLVTGLNISHENHFDAFYSRLGFQVSNLLCLLKGILMHDCEHLMEVHGMHA
jgi:hypothetical protein